MANFDIKKMPKASMSKKTKTIIFVILGIIYALVLGGICIKNYGKPVAQLSVETFCFDEKSAFLTSQVDSINERCKQVQSNYGVDVYVLTCNREGGSFGAVASKIGEDFLAEHGFATSDNLIVLIINMNSIGSENYNYHFDIYTYGECYNKITNKEINKLLYSTAGDNILVGGDKAYEGVLEMVTNLGKAYKFIYTNSVTALLVISLIISLITSLIIISVIKGKYKKERQVNNFAFDSNSKLDLQLSTDTYLRHTVTFVHINRDSGSGGFSSGGGGGSGHRGGR